VSDGTGDEDEDEDEEEDDIHLGCKRPGETMLAPDGVVGVRSVRRDQEMMISTKVVKDRVRPC
jgi:hypothetical protein